MTRRSTLRRFSWFDLIGLGAWRQELALLGVCLAIMVCATFGGHAKEVVISHHISQKGVWVDWVKERAEEFVRQNPGMRVEFSIRGKGMKEEDFLVLYAGGVTMDVTEMVLLQAGSVAAQGFFHDLRPFFSKDRDVSINDFVPITVQAMTWADGTLWGFPIDLFVLPTTYNADMFAELGLQSPRELDEDWTLDAALTASRKLTRDRDGDGELDQWGSNNVGVPFFLYRGPFENRGTPYLDQAVGSTRSLFNTPGVVETMDWVADFYRVYNATASHITYGTGGFETGLVGWSIANGPGVVATMSGPFRWGVALPPRGSKQGACIAVNSFQVPKTSQNPDAAWKWLRFLGGSQEAWDSFVRTTGRLPSNLRALQRWPKIIQASYTNLPEGVENYIRAAVHPDSYTELVGPRAATVKQIALPLVEKVLAGKVNTRQAMEDIHRQLDPLLRSSAR